MTEGDRKIFFELLSPVLEMYGRPLTDGALAIWWAALEPYPIEQIRARLSQHVASSKFAPLPADVIQAITLNDGRPGPEEAWSISLLAQDQRKTVVWTDDMLEAFNAACPLLDAGDAVAARMAFKESYERLVADARRNGVAVHWDVSLGCDKGGRIKPIEEAVRLGRIGNDMAQRSLPPPSDGGPIAAFLAGELPQLPKMSEKDRKDIASRLRELKNMLVAKEAA